MKGENAHDQLIVDEFTLGLVGPGVEVGRLPGVVQLTLLVPMDVLADRGIDHLVREQYGR